MGTENKRQPEPKDSWSEDGQIFFHYGRGYGVRDNLQPICLGEEDDIKKSFETSELSNELNPSQRQVLRQIQFRREQEIGVRETDMVRAGNDGIAGGKQKTASQTTKGKRLALRSSHKKYHHLLR